MMMVLMSLLVLSIATDAAPVTSHELSDLSKELLDDGLISLDDNKVPTTTCLVTSKNGTSSEETCKMTEGFGPRAVGCFTVWNSNGVMQQGCYSNQEISLRTQCKKRVCVADNKHKGISMCCCHGPLCNAKYSPKSAPN